MKRVGLLTAVCLGASLLTPTPPAVGASSDPVGLTLGATNVLKGRHSFTREVVLPAPATISDKVNDNKDFKVSGGGRVVGFSLVEADAPVSPTELNGLRLRFCQYRGCSSGKTNQFMGIAGRFDPTDDKPLLLRPGRYFLTFIADGAPARVTFKLDGLVGTSRWARGDKVAHYIGEPKRTYTSPTGTGYAAGSVDRLPENGVWMVALQQTSEISTDGQVGSCLWRRDRGKPPPPEEEYAFSCDLQGADAAGWVTGPAVPPPPTRTVLAHWVTVEKARWSHGVWANTTLPDVDNEPLAFWLAYPEPIDRTGGSSMTTGWDERP